MMASSSGVATNNLPHNVRLPDDVRAENVKA